MFGFNDITKFLVICLLGAVIVFYTRFVYLYRKFFLFSWKHNGFLLPILPVIGSTYISLFVRGKRNLLSMVIWMEKHFGLPMTVWIGHGVHSFYYLTADPTEIKAIFNHPKCLNKSYIYEDVEYIIGPNSLLFIAQEKWRGRKKHFMKSFKPNILKSFLDTYYKHSVLFAEKIKNLNGGVVPFGYIFNYTFKVFCITALGIDEIKFEKEISEYGVIRLKIEGALKSKLINPFIPINLWLKYFPTGIKAAAHLVESNSILERIISDRKTQLEGNQAFIDNSNEVPLLDLILSYNQSIMNDEEIYQELSLFTSAGTMTSSHQLYFGLTILGMYPDIQEKLYKEVIAEIGDNDITGNNIGNLVYTKAVINELMRILPVVPFLGRLVEEDITLGKKTFPKGINFIADVYHLHRSPDLWDNPDTFDPTRFLPENMDKIKPNSYMPFSQGVRDCIGKEQAMSLLRVTYASLIRNFVITSHHKSFDEFKMYSVLTISPAIPLDLHFTPRIKK